MQAIASIVPELDLGGNDAKAAPEDGARARPSGVLSFQLPYPALEILARRDGLTLRAGPRSELAAARSSREVSVGLRVGNTLDMPSTRTCSPVVNQWKARAARSGFGEFSGLADCRSW